MGACTSTGRRRRHQHNRRASTNSTVLEHKPLPALPSTRLVDQSFPHRQSHSNEFGRPLSVSSNQSIFHQTPTNSLIQFYSTNSNNNNNSHPFHSLMSSSSSSSSRLPPRIPVPSTRLPASPARPIRPTPSAGSSRVMSVTNRPPVPSAAQPRAGYIPRPMAPGIQHARATSFAARSRSISPSSTLSGNSSSSASLVSPRVNKPPATSKAAPTQRSTPTTTATSKSKVPPSKLQQSLPTPTSRRAAVVSPRAPPTSTPTPTKTDVNAIRDRYRTQKRMNFFTRHTPISSPLKSSSVSDAVEKSHRSSVEEHTVSSPNDPHLDDLNTVSSQPNSSSKDDSAYASIATRSAQLPSTTTAPAHRQRAVSLLSSSSAFSDVFNQDAILDDENCSLKSEDLLCDYDDTLTLDSTSKNFSEHTGSCSSNSLSGASHQPAASPSSHLAPRTHRSATVAKCSNIEKSPSNLRESLDELSRLSHRVDSTADPDHRRRSLTRCVSLKPPLTALPPLEDGEQLAMDIESYRQVMKDVMVVKTILHQLDRLLKQSDGTNMTDSMIGSFHESMISSRRYSSSTVDGNPLPSIDEDATYDDLVKEIVTLRKEREQDKQTIKLLQEQMYKYSSHNSS